MATLQNINVGTTPNDNTGDSLRDSMVKVNSNFQNVNDQSNTSTNTISRMKIWTETKGSGGDQVFTIIGGGYTDTTYEYIYNAYDSNGYEVGGVRRVSKTNTTITLNLPVACTVTIYARKI